MQGPPFSEGEREALRQLGWVQVGRDVIAAAEKVKTSAVRVIIWEGRDGQPEIWCLRDDRAPISGRFPTKKERAMPARLWRALVGAPA